MSWLSKLFGFWPAIPAAPAPEPPVVNPLLDFWKIPFGQYSDNNKSYGQIRKWFEADSNFQEKEYNSAFDCFFDHLLDPEAGNVDYRREQTALRFELLQGASKIVGQGDDKMISARTNLATMPVLSVPAMNRMLQRNHNLRYARFSLDGQAGLCLSLEIPVHVASPNRLYYGLRELALNADQFVEELSTDFKNLQPPGETAAQPVPEEEVRVKYKYFRQWITDCLKMVSGLQPDPFSGGIAYLLLTTIYRIGFLIAPEGALKRTLKDMDEQYWSKKDVVPLVSRNTQLAASLQMLLEISLSDFSQSMTRSIKTFSELAPPPRNKLTEHIRSANQDAEWYIANQYPDIAQVIVEYGLVFSLSAYSVPAIFTQLSTLFLYTQHALFFHELGIDPGLFHEGTGRLNPKRFNVGLASILYQWIEKYPQLRWDQSRILFDNLLDFARTYTEQVATLNLEIRR